MQQLRQHTFGCGHCTPCAVVNAVFTLFAGFVTVALTFAASLILSSTLYVNAAYAEVAVNNGTSAEATQTVQNDQNAKKEIAGQSGAKATAKSENAAGNGNAALLQNGASTSKNSESAASGAVNSAAATNAQNTTNNGSANATNQGAQQAKPATFSITYVVDGKSATTNGVAGTITLETLESKTTEDGITFTFLGWKLPDGTLLAPGSKFEVTEDVTLTAAWKIGTADTNVSIQKPQTINKADSLNTAEKAEIAAQPNNPVLGPGYDLVVIPTESETNDQFGNDMGGTSSASNGITTLPNPDENLLIPEDPNIPVPPDEQGKFTVNLDKDSSETEITTVNPHAPPSGAPSNSSSTGATEDGKSSSEDDADHGTDADATTPEFDVNVKASTNNATAEDNAAATDPNFVGPIAPAGTITNPADDPEAAKLIAAYNNKNNTTNKEFTIHPALAAAKSSGTISTAALTKNYWTPGNTTIWWTWDSATGTLTLGNDATADTELADFTPSTLPWLTATSGGATPNEIKHIVTSVSSRGARIIVKQMTGWFENYTALLTFDATGLSVTQATSLERLFKGCQNLTSISNLDTWRSEATTNYAEMFSGCSSLKALDLSGLYTADFSGTGAATTSTKNRTNMLAGMTSLDTLKLGAHTSLDGSGLQLIPSRLDSLGKWEAQATDPAEAIAWKGTASQFIQRYPATGGIAPDDTGTLPDPSKPLSANIIYVFHVCGTFPSNDKVHWDYNSTTKTITIHADYNAGAGETHVTDTYMPWLDAITQADVTRINFSRKDLNGNDVWYVTFASLGGLFQGYTNLVSFSGVGLNTANNLDFSNFLAGCTALTSVDISTWEMRAQAAAATLNIQNMLQGCAALNTISVGDGVVLYTSAANTAGLESLYGRGEADGVWERKNSTLDPWFGTSTNLAKRYNTYGTGCDHGSATYVFTTAYRGARFDDNDNVWWKYVVSGNKHTLVIGADPLEPGETGGYTIDWDIAARGQDLPWNKVVNGQPLVDKTKITHIETKGTGTTPAQAKPLNMANWFAGYTALTSFDGSGWDTSSCINYTNLFQGCTALARINISTWNTSGANPADRADMFDGCTALEYLILGPYVNLTGCNLQALPGHSTDDGTWCRQESSTDSWMGSGADLIKRYNGTGSEGEQLGAGAAIYFFDTSILRNVFDSNLNVWWQYNKKNQILLIGVNKNATNVTITETANQQPWLRVLGGGTTQAAYDAARAMIVRVDFRDLVTVLHPEHWFDGYTLMADAYVGNMDISQATSLQGVFNGCTSLSIISGLRNWDTTNVTDMSHLFDGCIFTNLAGIESWNDKLANVINLSYIFANNPNVTTLENVAGWNLPAATNFAHAFENDARLSTLDISNWDMTRTTAADRENMLFGLDNLTTFTLGNKILLADTGLGLSSTTSLPRGDTFGTWQANRVTQTQGGIAENAWFGTSADLMRRYATLLNLGDDITYTWRAGQYGGRIPQGEPGNLYEDLWWKFVMGTDDVSGTPTGTLTVGTDNPNGTTYQLNHTTAPWLNTIYRLYGDADAQAGLAHITHFVAQAGKAIAANIFLTADSFQGMFARALGYTNLQRFNGAGFDTTHVTDFSHLFDGVATLTQATGMNTWHTANVTDMSYMFNGNTRLQGIAKLTPGGNGIWDVSNVTSFAHMFDGCSTLTELTDFAEWNVHGNVDLSYMLNGCSALTNLDIWKWDMTGQAATPALRENMLAGLTAIERLGVSTRIILQDTGIDTITSRLPHKGSWDRIDNTWFGTTKNLCAVYHDELDLNGRTNTISLQGQNLDTAVYYTWAQDNLRGRFENDNAWWRIVWKNTAHTSAELYIGIYNQLGSHIVTETWDETPWTSVLSDAIGASGTRNGNNVITFISMQNGITPQNFALWFANYANLADFDGKGAGDGVVTTNTGSLEGLFKNDTKLQIVDNIKDWDVTNVTNFNSLFENCQSLYSIDIHNWLMPAGSSHVNMLAGTNALRTLILNGTVSLMDSALGQNFTSSLADGTAGPVINTTRGPQHGSWARIVNGTENTLYPADPWFGSSDDLLRRYAAATNHHGMGDSNEGAIYVWTTDLRGRFADNDNAWWSYDASRRILILGVDAPEGGEVYDMADATTFYLREVTAGPNTANTLPWEIAKPDIKTLVRTIYAQLTGALSIRPTTMEGWFQNYTALESFDGTNFDTALFTAAGASLDNLFNGATALKTVNLTNWNWANGASHTDMFKDLNSIESITLEAGAALDTTGFGSISTRPNTAGRWVMDNVTTGPGAADIPWFDSSAKLEMRYPGNSNGVVLVKLNDGTWAVADYLQGIHTYTWDNRVLGGRFEENPNVWWTFHIVDIGTTKAGTLTIGSDNQDALDATNPRLQYDASYNVVATNPAGTGSYGQIVNIHGTATPGAGAGPATDYTYSSLDMPWASAIGNIARILSVATDADHLVRPTSMLAWFANLTGMITFVGDGLDMTYTNGTDSYQGVFSGDNKMQNVDIHAWDMASNVTDNTEVRDMLQNCSDLWHVTVGKRTVLDGSGFNVNLPKRTQKDGSWVHDLWFGSATEVSDMFLPNIGANAAGLAEFPDGADAITFDWDAGNLCGRFESNKKVWWRYTGNPPAGDPYLHKGLLRIGSDSKNIAESYVTESGDAVPWRAILDNINTITEVITAADNSGKVGVASLEGWFGHNTLNGVDQYHTGLTTFDGSGLVLYAPEFATATPAPLPGCSSVAGLFEGADHLNNVKGINGWDTHTVMNFARAFYNTPQIPRLDIRSWQMTQVPATDTAAFEDMFKGMGSANTNYFESITLGPLAVLTNTGFGLKLDGTPFKEPTSGYWTMGDPLNGDPTVANPDVKWFDNTDGLVERYEIGYGSKQAHLGNLAYVHTYTWDSTATGGHFDSNRNVWWLYEFATKALTIGAFDKNATVEYADDWSTTYAAGTTGWLHRVTETGAQNQWHLYNYLPTSFRADAAEGKVAPETMESWFDAQLGGAKASYTSFDGVNLDTSHVTSMRNLFYGQTTLASATGMSSWLTPVLTDLAYAFYNNTNLSTLTAIGNWDVADVTDFSFMFYHVGKVDPTANLSWHTTSAQNFESMFEGATMVPNTNYLRNWDVQWVTNFKRMFFGATGLTAADSLANWEVGKHATHATMVDLTEMFRNCTNLTKVDFTTWMMLDLTNNEELTITTNFLANDGKIVQIVMGVNGLLENSGLGYTENGGTQLDSMKPNKGGWKRLGGLVDWFGTSADLTTAYTPGSVFQILDNLIYTYVWNSDQTGGNEFPSNRNAWWKFLKDSGTLIIGINDNVYNDPDYHLWVTERYWELPWLVDINGNNDVVFKRSDIKHIEFVGDIHIINPAYWFAGYDNLLTADLMNMHIDLAGSLEGLFGILPTEYVNDAGVTVQVTDNPGKADPKLTTVTGLETWNTELSAGVAGGSVYGKPKVNTTSFKGLFQGAAALRNLEYVMGWDVSTITDMSFMFDGCAALNDVSQFATWNTSAVTTMEAMFRNVTTLRVVDGVLTWNTRNVTNFNEMFYNAKSVTDLDFSGADWKLTGAKNPDGTYNTTNMLAKMDGLRYLTLPDDFVLTGTGLENSDTHESLDGTWEQEGFTVNGTTTKLVAWWGDVYHLVERYPDGAKPWITVEYAPVWDQAQYLTYTFKTNYIGGRFESNKYAWWKYDKNGTLTISVDHVLPDGTPQTEFRISEDTDSTTLTSNFNNANWMDTNPQGNYDIPWLKIIKATDVVNVYMRNQISPVNPNGMFANTADQPYTNLVLFDGSSASMQFAVSLESMFQNANKLEKVSSGMAGWTAMPFAASMKYMFAGCTALKEITGINRWDVTRVQDFSGMFDMSILGEAGGQLGDTLLTQVGNWTLGTAVPGGQLITMANMFKDLRNMTTLEGLKNWDTSRVGDFTGMFSSSKNDKGVTYTYSAGRLEKTEGTKGMLLKDITAINNWNITAVTSLEQMFENGIRIEKVNLSNWNMRGKSLTNMFKNCASINEITLGLLSVLEDTAFGDDMFFIQTVPTNASGSSNKVVNVYWRDRINKDQAETTFGGLIWQAGHYGGAWIAEDANRNTANDYEGYNLWNGTTNNLALLYTQAAHFAPATVTTYKWGGAFYGGVFESSIHQDPGTGLWHYNDWWRYYSHGINEGTLIMGTTGGSANNYTQNAVTEANNVFTGGTNDLPWAKYADANIPELVKHVKTGAILHTDGTITYDCLLGVIAPVNFAGWFYNHKNLIDFDGIGLDAALTTSMAHLFDGCEKMTTLTSIAHWDVTHITDFSYMFNNCKAMTDFSALREWVLGTSNVNMSYMFAGSGIGSLTPLTFDVANNYWNTNGVTNMEGMFQGAKNIKTQEPIIDWDVSNVYTMANMFKNATALTVVNLSRWAMRTAGGKVHNGTLILDGMFEGCSALGQLTVGESSVLQGTAFNNSLANHGPTTGATGGMWELTHVNGTQVPRTSHGYAPWFGSTGSLAYRYPATGASYADVLTYTWRNDLIGERFDSNPYAWWVFDKHNTLTFGIDTGADANDFCRMPGDTTSAATYGLTVTEVQDATTDLPWISKEFDESDSTGTITNTYHPIARTNVVNVSTKGGIWLQNPANWFMDYTELVDFDGGGMDIPNATSIANFFKNDGKLQYFTTKTGGWSASNLTDMSYFLYGTALRSLNVFFHGGTGGADVSNIRNMSYAFANMKQLTDADGLELWLPTSSVADPLNLTGLFQGDTALEVVRGLQNWVIPGANLTDLFSGCSKLHTVDIHSMDMRDMTVTNMFANCSALGDYAKGGYIRVSALTRLTDTGLQNAPNRTTKDGMWLRQGEDPIGWFGSSNQLIQLYPDGATGIGNQITSPAYLDYSWDNTRRGGRFDSNPHAWWMYFIKNTTFEGEEMRAGTLLLGSDFNEPNKIVTETDAQLPWLDDPSTPGVVDPVVSKTEVTQVKTKHGIAPTNPAGCFNGYTNLTSFDGMAMTITNAVTSLKDFFRNDAKLNTVRGVDKWDVSNVTDMSGMFYNNDGLTSAWLTQIGNWNVSSVTTLKEFLYDADGITNLDGLENWRPGSVADLSYAFYHMNKLTSIEGLRNWNPGAYASVTSMNLSYMLAYNQALLDVTPITGSSADPTAAHWYVEKVTDFSYLFYQLAANSNDMKITTIDLSQWDMRTDSYRQGNLKLNNMLTLATSGSGKTNIAALIFGPNTVLWKDASNNANLQGTRLMSVTEGVWIKNTNALGKETTVGNSEDLMKRYGAAVTAPTEITTYTWDNTHRGGTFADNLNAWWTYAVVDTTSVADKDTAEKAGTLRVGLVADSLSHAVNVTGSSLPWRQSPNNVWSSVKTFQTDGTNGKLAPVTMAQWFANASSNFTTFDGSYLDTSNATSFEQMFYNDTALLEITGTGSWITSKVTTFAGMFQNVTQVREFFMDTWNMRGTVGGRERERVQHVQ